MSDMRIYHQPLRFNRFILTGTMKKPLPLLRATILTGIVISGVYGLGPASRPA